MAKIYKMNNDLIKEYKAAKKKFINCWLFFFAIAAAVMLSGLLFRTPILFGTLPVTLLVIAFISARYKNKMEILYSGIEGEQNSAKLISRLPDTYCAFQNLKVKFDGKTSETDLVLVGPTGIFIIEIKNLNGQIVGSYDAQHWIQHKVGRGGTPYSKKLYSPIKQVGTHVYRLANVLRKNGIRTYVNACVFFCNDECELNLSGAAPKTPVFNDIEDLYSHILEFNNNLSNEEISKICKLLLGRK